MTVQASSKVPQIRFNGFGGEWEQRRFRDIVSSLSGGASIKPEDYQKDGIRTVPKGSVNSSGIANLSGCKYVSGYFFSRNQSGKVSTGNLITSLRDLVPSAPNLGRIVKIEGHDEDFLMPQGVYKIELQSGVNEAFVISYSNGEKFRKIIASGKNGSTQVHLRNGEFLDISIATPPHFEQTQIGKYFRELDSLIGLHQRKHDKLVTLKKAMLQKMFPQPGTTTPEIRFKGFEGDWVEKTLAEISEIKTGPFGSTLHAKDYVSDGVPIITTEHFKFWCLPDTIRGLPQVSTSDYKRLKNYVLKHGDIVFSRVGSIDINAHVEEKQNGWLFSGRVLRVRTPPSIDSEYLHHELSTDRARKCVTERAVGQTMPCINTAILGGTVVFLPGQKTEQQKISTYFRTLDTLIAKHATQLQKLQQIKSACLEKMFV